MDGVIAFAFFFVSSLTRAVRFTLIANTPSRSVVLTTSLFLITAIPGFYGYWALSEISRLLAFLLFLKLTIPVATLSYFIYRLQDLALISFGLLFLLFVAPPANASLLHSSPTLLSFALLWSFWGILALFPQILSFAEERLITHHHNSVGVSAMKLIRQIHGTFHGLGATDFKGTFLTFSLCLFAWTCDILALIQITHLSAPQAALSWLRRTIDTITQSFPHSSLGEAPVEPIPVPTVVSIYLLITGVLAGLIFLRRALRDRSIRSATRGPLL